MERKFGTRWNASLLGTLRNCLSFDNRRGFGYAYGKEIGTALILRHEFSRIQFVAIREIRVAAPNF